MNWKTTESNPERGQRILVLRNAYHNLTGTDEIDAVLETGTYKGTVHSSEDVDRWIVDCGGDRVLYLRVTDIHGWITERSVIYKGFNVCNKTNCTIMCPHCNELSTIMAEAIDLDWVNMPVLRSTLDDELYLDWDNIDAQCNFHYVCENCSEQLANTLEDVKSLLKPKEENENA